MAELPRLRVGLTLDSQTFIRETNRVIDSVNNLGRQMERQNRSITQSLRGLEDGVGRVGGALRALGALVGVGSFAALAKQAIDAADAYTVLQGRLRLVSENADAAAEAQSRLVQIAALTRTSLQAVTDLYTRLSLTLQDAGVASEDLLQVTEAVAQASRLAGGSAASIAAGIFQFSQAMGSGVLRGQELISVMEQVPGLAVALSRGLNVPISQFKRLGEEGFFTTERVLNALLEQLPELSREADSMGTTVGQAFQQLRDSLTLTIGEVSTTTGVSRDLADAIIEIADALRSPELAEAFQNFITGFLGEMRQRLQTTREEFERLVDAFDTGRDFLSQFGLAAPQSLEAINDRIADINEELARMLALNRETAAGPEKAVRQSVIQALTVEREALVKRRAELDANAKAATDTAKATDALTVSIRRAAKIEIPGSGSTSKQAQTRALAQFREMTAVSDRFIKRRNELAFKADQDAARERERLNKNLNESILREQERLAERQQELIIRPFENALDNVQGLFTDTFEEIYSGGISSFEELAGAVKDIFVRLAAELTTLMLFKPVLQAQAAGTLFSGLGGAGAAGTATAATAAMGGGFMTPGGQFIPNVPSAQTAGWNAALLGGPTAFGAGMPELGGGFRTPSGQFVPLLGNGGAGSWWTTPQRGLGPLMLAGGLGFAGGSMLGGFTGSSTGGGFGGALGAVAGTALLGPLGGIAGGVLGGLGGGLFGSLFGGGGSRGRDTTGGAGILGAAGLGGTGQAAQFVRTLDRQLVGLMTARQEQIANASLQFAPAVQVKYQDQPSANDLARLAAGRVGPTAAAFGLNVGAITAGTAEEQTANLQTALGLLRQIEGFRIGPIATQFRDLEDTFAEMTAEAARLGVSTEGLAEAHRREADALNRRIHLERIALSAQVGALDPLTAALQTLATSMQEAAAQAEALGISTRNISREHFFQANILVQQSRLERHGLMQTFGIIDEFDRAILDLNAQMQIAWNQAERLGISTAGMHREFARLAAEIERTREARIDQLALGITQPFEALLEPLREFSQELQFGNLNPAGQMQAAADEFRRIANLAQAGSTTAIQQLQGAGQAFIAQAERFGASPAGVSARLEVQSVIEGVMGSLEQAQREASAGVEDAVRQAQNRIVDTLRELISEGALTREEIKRLRR